MPRRSMCYSADNHLRHSKKTYVAHARQDAAPAAQLMRLPGCSAEPPQHTRPCRGTGRLITASGTASSGSSSTLSAPRGT